MLFRRYSKEVSESKVNKYMSDGRKALRQIERANTGISLEYGVDHAIKATTSASSGFCSWPTAQRADCTTFYGYRMNVVDKCIVAN